MASQQRIKRPTNRSSTPSLQHAFEPISYPKLSKFELFNFSVNSEVLKGNPLGDPSLRNNPLLVPKSPITKSLVSQSLEIKDSSADSVSFSAARSPSHRGSDSTAERASKKWGLIFVLSGFAGNGTKALGDRGFEETLIQQINHCRQKNNAPEALYCFVDAWTFWGGSQFLNSKGMGRYEDYIVQELYPLLLQNWPIDPKRVAIVGHSSGGYGALHLASKYPQLFSYCGSLSPDCFFEGSLLPDFYKSAPYLLENSDLKTLSQAHHQRKLFKLKQGFQILNCIAMTLCYSPESPSKKGSKKLSWPLDLATGLLQPAVWKTWKEKDPLVFLKKRQSQLKKLKGFYIEVGRSDEFHLQFGVRQIHQWLQSRKVRHHFVEFDGGHFESHPRFQCLWIWLLKMWKTEN